MSDGAGEQQRVAFAGATRLGCLPNGKETA
jgi:hypothetical protein